MTHPSTDIPAFGVTIRRLGAADDPVVRRLAQLDSADAPQGALLGAEIEGRLVAAVGIETGEAVADPFSRTGELKALLELRAAQMRRREGGSRSRFGRLRRHTPGALPSSPPGAGGKLLSLPIRPY
jgi:hypothetical protein